MQLPGIKIFRTSTLEDTINIASYLNPRFKVQHLGDELPLIKQSVVREGVEMMGSGGISEDNKDIQVSETQGRIQGGHRGQMTPPSE